MSYDPHELRPVRTTLQPDVELQVNGQEEENLRLLGILLPAAPAADVDVEKSPAPNRPRRAATAAEDPAA